MCGIAGVCWSNPSRLPDYPEIRRMVQVLAHRGPDDAGLYHSDAGLITGFDSADATTRPAVWPKNSRPESGHPHAGAILGHRRLSIIDLGGGRQPLSNEDGSVWVVLNGEIYNYRELTAELRVHGHVFRTETDTEVIVHLYEQYGDRFVEHLRGMFALAVWDHPRRRLILARDRIGQKPLTYRLAGGRLDFASELKALLQLNDTPRDIDLTALDSYLTYQYVPHPASILSGCRKLPPAHFAVFENGGLTVQRYWQPKNTTSGGETPDEQHSSQDWHRRLREVLTQAVQLRLRSDVPLGAFLSGGIDSTIIAGLMQQLSSRPVHTFSIGFRERKFDERSFARQAARHLGTRHSEQVVEASALQILPRLLWHFDEPFADSSAIPTLYLSEMTRSHVTVALSGDGGDELFAGYDRYRAVRLASRFDRLPGFVRRVAASRLWQRLPASVEQKSLRRRLKRLLQALPREPIDRYLQWISIFDEPQRQHLYEESAARRLSTFRAAAFLEECYARSPCGDMVSRTAFADMLSYLPCDIMTKVDTASMAVGLECRSPFLDHHVAELATAMPIGLKLRGRQGKRILIDVFRDLLPPAIRKRPKMGFGVPLDQWFRNELTPLLHDVLLSDRALSRGLFRPDAIRQLVDEHTGCQRDHSSRLWSLLVLELWQRTWIDGAVPEHPPASVTGP